MYGLARIQGLTKEKARIYRAIVSCRKRGTVFPHVLICGLGGTGKSLLAEAIAEELGYHLVVVEAAALPTRQALISRLMRASEESRALNKTLLFFIDECHRLSIDRQEALYYPMEQHRITTKDGIISFPAFCLVAATTQPQLLDQGSFVTRMERGLRLVIGRYHKNDVMNILITLFKEMDLVYSQGVISAIADRCLGVPRNARNLAEKIRDQVIFRGGTNVISLGDVDEVIKLEGLDSIGLNENQVELLKILAESKGVPRGRGLLAARLSMSETAIEEVVEPILLSLGFMDHSPRGRILTGSGYNHLKKQGLI